MLDFGRINESGVGNDVADKIRKLVQGEGTLPMMTDVG